MDKINLVANSELMSLKYGVPVIPQHNNPHIYAALVFKVLGNAVPALWLYNYERFAHLCVVTENNKPKYLTRWPDGTGGNFSHDEIIGMAVMSKQRAIDIYELIKRNYGVMPDMAGKWRIKRIFIPRYPFLPALLRHHGGYNVNIISKLLLTLHILFSCFKVRKDSIDPDSIIKIWLMKDCALSYKLTSMAYMLFFKCVGKVGITPKVLFSKHYLFECPTMAAIAGDRW